MKRPFLAMLFVFAAVSSAQDEGDIVIQQACVEVAENANPDAIKKTGILLSSKRLLLRKVDADRIENADTVYVKDGDGTWKKETLNREPERQGYVYIDLKSAAPSGKPILLAEGELPGRGKSVYLLSSKEDIRLDPVHGQVSIPHLKRTYLGVTVQPDEQVFIDQTKLPWACFSLEGRLVGLQFKPNFRDRDTPVVVGFNGHQDLQLFLPVSEFKLESGAGARAGTPGSPASAKRGKLFKSLPEAVENFSYRDDWTFNLRPLDAEQKLTVVFQRRPDGLEWVEPGSLQYASKNVPVMGGPVVMTATSENGIAQRLEFEIQPEKTAMEMPGGERPARHHLYHEALDLLVLYDVGKSGYTFIRNPPSGEVETKTFPEKLSFLIEIERFLVSAKANSANLVVIDPSGKQRLQTISLGDGKIESLGRGADGRILVLFAGKLETKTGRFLLRYDLRGKTIEEQFELARPGKYAMKALVEDFKAVEYEAPDGFEPEDFDGTGSGGSATHIQEPVAGTFVIDRTVWKSHQDGYLYRERSFPTVGSEANTFVYFDAMPSKVYVMNRNGTLYIYDPTERDVVGMFPGHFSRLWSPLTVYDDRYMLLFRGSESVPGYTLVHRDTGKVARVCELPEPQSELFFEKEFLVYRNSAKAFYRIDFTE